MPAKAILRSSLIASVALCAVCSEFPSAQSSQLVAATYYNTFSRAHPVLARIRPGETVRTKTIDASGRDETGTVRARPPNPLTGPFFVEGAEVGDAIAVRFTRMRMNRKWGFTAYRLGLYSLTPESIEGIYPNRYKPNTIIEERVNVVPWDLDLERQTVRLREPSSNVLKMEFPAKPMLGCVGVAPAGDFAPTSSPAGSYGGNLDYNEINEGTTVLLPVYHPGALLFIGDGHALQGDGEPIGTGIETSMDVEFTVTLRKKASLSGPRAETSDYIISIGSQPEFVSSTNRGLQLATSDMVSWLTSDYKLEPWAAHLLIGYQGEVRGRDRGRHDGAQDSEEVAAAMRRVALRFRLLYVAVAAILGHTAYATQSPSSATTAAPAPRQAIDAVLAGAVKRGDVPGVMALVTDRTGVIYQGAFGSADTTSDRPHDHRCALPHRVDDQTDYVGRGDPVVRAGPVRARGSGGQVSLGTARSEGVRVVRCRTGAYALSRPQRTVTLRHLLDPYIGTWILLHELHCRDFKPRGGEVYPAGPLLFEPGEQWIYGTNIDWMGRLVESLRANRSNSTFAIAFLIRCRCTIPSTTSPSR